MTKDRERLDSRSNVATTPAAREIAELLGAGRTREAILKASKMRELGPQKDRILSAREAYQRPDFQQSLGKDPQALILDGVAALRERFCVAS